MMVKRRGSSPLAAARRPVRDAPPPACLLECITLSATSLDDGSADSGGSLEELVSACVLVDAKVVPAAVKRKGRAAAAGEVGAEAAPRVT